MGTASFKSFGFPFPTWSVRVPMDAGFAAQQARAGYDVETQEDRRLKQIKKTVDVAQARMANVSYNTAKKKRFIM